MSAVNGVRQGQPTAAPATTSPRDRRRLSAWLLRLSIIVVVLPLATMVERQDGLLLGLVAALGWAPVTSGLDAWQRRTGSRVPDLLAVVADWSLLLGIAAVVPEAAAMVALGSLPLVAWWASVEPRTLGVPAALLSIAPVTIALVNYEAPSAIIVGAPMVFSVVVAGLFWLQRQATRERASATANLHRLHRRSSAILTGIGEAVVVTDATGGIREVNRAGVSVLGLPEDAAGHHCSLALGLRAGARPLDCSNGCALLALTGTDSGDAEVTRWLSEGVAQPLLAGAQVVGSGPHAEVVHSFRDITRLRQAEEAKSLFLATASHELKTPITVIQGFAEILAAGRARGEELEDNALAAITRRTRDLSRIVDRILLSSRIEHGHVELSPTPIDVEDALLERVESLDQVLETPIRLTCDDRLPLVYGDTVALATVIDHLLENAVKYSPGGMPVLVTATADADDVVIRVTDQGIGMTPEQVEHCFEQFWQAEASDVRRYGGTGIGLYIVRSLVDAMRGEIAVESTPGVGTTFEVRLTSRPPAEDDPDVGRPQDMARASDAAESIIEEFMRQIGVGVGPGAAA